MTAPILSLIMSIFNIYLMIVVIRLWLQFARADFYNPFSQFTVKATQPIIGPLRRFIPSFGQLDTATLVFAIAISYAKVLTYALISAGSLPPLFTAFVFALFGLVHQILWLIFIVLIVRAILSWVSQGNHPLELVMGQLTEPMLRPVRKVLPAMGGLDLSVLVFLLGLQFIINVFSTAFGPFI